MRLVEKAVIILSVAAIILGAALIILAASSQVEREPVCGDEFGRLTECGD